jgi:hydroxyacyl-ACP dehydratase HTD2-like protein with hotdog domain
MRAKDFIDEAPLPPDWDTAAFKQDTTSYKSRLAYALERAKKIGTGSSRVATTIEYEGRPTVLKIAKNGKGLAQNSVEVDILGDGYASQMGILIPMIDYDTQNREPLWVHTELATKANEKQLCSLMKCLSLMELVQMAQCIAGKSRFVKLDDKVKNMRDANMDEEDIEIAIDYANKLAELTNSFDVNLGDFVRPANWGIFNGRPVILDVGFTDAVYATHYKK